MTITFNMIFRKNKEEPLKQANIKTDRLSEKSKTTLSQYDRLRMIQSQSERKVV